MECQLILARGKLHQILNYPKRNYTNSGFTSANYKQIFVLILVSILIFTRSLKLNNSVCIWQALSGMVVTIGAEHKVNPFNWKGCVLLGEFRHKIELNVGYKFMKILIKLRNKRFTFVFCQVLHIMLGISVKQ